MECAEFPSRTFAVRDYNLGMTLTSGQAFRWRNDQGHWSGVIHNRWVRLHETESSIIAQTAEPLEDWSWLIDYLQVDLDLRAVLETFPMDKPMQAAVLSCRGLRLLRQDPWECLASFILSSTKQILQIQQIISLICERYGEPVRVVPGLGPAYGFPGPDRLASLSEQDLRACKMGFRAPFLLSAARQVAEGKLDLQAVKQMQIEEAREELLKLKGVGNKIADCVLLFAFGHQAAFPVDVWVMKALRELYFPRRKMNLKQLQSFASTHFGPQAGYAQQYLFHYARTGMKKMPQNKV